MKLEIINDSKGMYEPIGGARWFKLMQYLAVRHITDRATTNPQFLDKSVGISDIPTI